jgi:ketosteroid isomerase-like protein
MRRAIAQRTIRRSYGAFNRGDLDLLRAMYDPELVWDWSHVEGWLDDPVLRGFDHLRREFLSWRQTWGEFVGEPSELRDFGDTLMLTGHMRVTGSGSGVTTEMTWWQVVSVRDGLIARLANYSDRQEALDAARQPK